MKVYYFLGKSGRVYMWDREDRDLHNAPLKIDVDLNTSELYEFVREYIRVQNKGKREGWLEL
jgi:hypothetical protein